MREASIVLIRSKMPTIATSEWSLNRPMKALTIEGSYVGSLQDMKDLMALVEKEHIPAPPITKRPLDDAQAAIDDLRQGKVTGRTVLVP